MISLHKCPDLSSIADLKAQYPLSLVAPMDGMWETGFTDPAPHWEVRLDGELAAYYAANDEGMLLQFYVRPEFEIHARGLFEHVIAQDTLTQAVVSTIDPLYLSLCLEVQSGIRVHTYLYGVQSEVRPEHPEADELNFRVIEGSELERTIAFQQACLGGEQDLTGWLRGYSGNLIDRNEIFVLSRGDDWIGLGECRKSDSQDGVTDVGMMVDPAQRGKGWATYILTLLTAYCSKAGQQAICSTTVENIGAQKAILRAGFISRHRMMNVTL